jgi:hypothetical protein
MWLAVVLLLVILCLSILVIRKMDKIDAIWDDFWAEIQRRPNVVPRREPPVTWVQRLAAHIAQFLIRLPKIIPNIVGAALVIVGTLVAFSRPVAVSWLTSPAVGITATLAGVLAYFASLRTDRDLAVLALTSAFLAVTVLALWLDAVM